MTRAKLANIVKLIGTIATAVMAIWLGPTALGTLDQKIAQTLIVGCALALNAAQWSQVQNVFLSIATVGGLLLTFLAMKIPHGGAMGAIVPVALAVWTDLAKALGKPQVSVTQDFVEFDPDRIFKQAVVESQGPRDPQKGAVTSGVMFILGMALTLLGVVAVLLFAPPAKAETSPQFGGCFDSGKVCLGPSATISVGQFNLSTSKFQGGVIPGVGYGLTYAPDQWYATGLSLYASFLVGQGTANTLTPSLMFSFANYVRIGAGLAMAEQASGPVSQQWLLQFGLGSDFGGSPAYVKAATARANQ